MVYSCAQEVWRATLEEAMQVLEDIQRPRVAGLGPHVCSTTTLALWETETHEVQWSAPHL